MALEGLLNKVDIDIEDFKAEQKKKRKEKLLKADDKIKEVEEEDEEDSSDEEESEEETDSYPRKKPNIKSIDEQLAEEEKKLQEELDKERTEKVLVEEIDDNDRELPPKIPIGDEAPPQNPFEEEESEENEPSEQQNEPKDATHIAEDTKTNIQIEKKAEDLSEISFNNGEISKAELVLQKVPSSSYEVVEGSKQEIKVKKDSNISEISFEEIASIKEEQKSKKNGNISEISFSEVGSVNIKIEKSEKLENFEHLANIDPEDEWLKMETGSIIESISEIRRQGSVSYSEFSAVDYNHAMNNQVNIVKTKGDIFVQDTIMQKIIRYIGMFSGEVKNSLRNIRSKHALLSASTQNETHDAITDYFIDMDDINIEFVYLVLDLLEHYKLYKLCIFVCNRYGLSQKVGRYLANVATKYSNFAADNLIADSIKLYNKTQRLIQGEKAFIANVALHNVLENINPNFLRLKKYGEISDQTNSLGIECFSELINLGFWKKILFLMDYHNALALSSTYASFKNYKMIFVKENPNYVIQGLEKKLEKEDFEFLPFETPRNYDEVKACYVALDSVIWDLHEKHPYILHKNYIPNPNGEIEVPQFPSFFAFNGILWNFLVHKTPEFDGLFDQYLNDSLSNLIKIIKNADFKSDIIELRIYDLITFFIQIILLQSSVPSISDKILLLSDSKFEDLMLVVKNLLTMSKNILRMSKYQETIMKALITPFRMRFIEEASIFTQVCSGYYMVHLSCPIMADIFNFSTSPGQTPVIYDIEANFIACPISNALEAIRTKIIGSVKGIMSNRMRNIMGTSYDEVHERLEKHLHIVGIIETYRYVNDFSSGVKTMKNLKENMARELRYKKTDPLYQYAKAELKLKLDKLMDTMREISTFELEERRILKEKLEKEIKEIKSTLRYNEVKNLPFEEQRISIFNSLKNRSHIFKNSIIKLSPLAKESILGTLFDKMKGMFKKSKLKPNYINMFYMLGEEVYLHELSRSNRNKWIAKELHTYSDALFYKRFYCVEEYAHNLFEYLASSFKLLTLEQKVYLLYNAAPSIIIATALGQKKNTIALNTSMTDLIEDLDIKGDKDFMLKKDIFPIESFDPLYELVYWAEKIYKSFNEHRLDEGENRIRKYTKVLLEILMNVAINVAHFDAEVSSKTSETLRNIILENVEEFANLSSLTELKTKDDFSRFASNFNVSSNKLTDFSFFRITIESDIKKAELNLEKCEEAYLKMQVTVAKHIILKRKLMKFYDTRKFIKMRNKAGTDFSSGNFIINTFRGLTTYKFVVNNIFTLMKRNSGLLEIFTDINTIMKEVIYFFFGQRITNPIDFHYLMNLLRNLAEIAVGYSTFIRDVTERMDLSSSNQQMFVAKKNQLTELTKEFMLWKQSKEQKENLDSILRHKKKKILGVKWEERATIGKLQKIAKKKGSEKDKFKKNGKTNKKSYK